MSDRADAPSAEPAAPDPLAERLAFLGFDAAAVKRLETLSPMVIPHVDEALGRFYDKIEKTPNVARFFAGRPQMDSVQAKQSAHWVSVATGKLDAEYFASSLRIGDRHAKIGLEPQWYIGGYGLVLETIIKGAMKDWMATQTVHMRKRKPAEIMAAGDDMAAGLADLVKAVMVDIDLAVSTYFSALEARIEDGRKQAEQRAEVQQDVLQKTGAALGSLARGHLDTRIGETFSGDFARLGTDFNTAAASLEDAVIGIRRSVDAISGSARAVAGSAIDLSDRLNRQAAAIEQSSASLDEVTSTVRETASGTRDAASLAQGADAAAREGGTVVGNTAQAMHRIEQSSTKISSIISVIDEIAFQTNLLALNAAVEAARAGEAGRGFAVVATEVRALAQRSAQAAKDVSALISQSGKEVENGVGMVNRTGDALSDIVERVASISRHMQTFSDVTSQQADSLSEVNGAIVQLDRLTQENAAFVDQAGEAGRDLDMAVEDLYQRLSAFRTAS